MALEFVGFILSQRKENKHIYTHSGVFNSKYFEADQVTLFIWLNDSL